MAAVAAMVLRLFAADSFGAENVAPTKAELEEMYNAAFRAFDSNKFAEALKQLDAIDARQPDLAASKNLRGVILMRQGNYEQAEAALQDASRIDPKFWNARFNMAEIPFLKKDWAEARNRFEQLLSNGESDLAKEASQLIQYKILLTYLMEGKDNMVDSILGQVGAFARYAGSQLREGSRRAPTKESEGSEGLDQRRGEEFFATTE